MPIGRVTTRSAGTAILWSFSLQPPGQLRLRRGLEGPGQRRVGRDVRAEGVTHLARSESGEVVDPGIEMVLECGTQA